MPTQPMLKFVKFDRDMPAKRIADERKRIFRRFILNLPKRKQRNSQADAVSVVFLFANLTAHCTTIYQIGFI